MGRAKAARKAPGEGHEQPWIAAYAAMTGGWARFIAPLQKNLPLSGPGTGHRTNAGPPRHMPRWIPAFGDLCITSLRRCSQRTVLEKDRCGVPNQALVSRQTAGASVQRGPGAGRRPWLGLLAGFTR